MLRSRISTALRLGATGGVAVLLVGLVGCSSSEPEGGGDNPIKIGVDLSLTGPIAFAGTQELAGIKLATEVINEEGGVLGRPIELVITDDASTPDQAILNIRKLVQQEGVSAIAGPGSSNSTVVGAETASDLKVPLVALPSNVGDIWEGPDRVEWGFGTGGAGSGMGYGCISSVVAAEEAAGNEVQTITIGNEVNPGPQSYVAGVREYAEEHGIDVVTELEWAGDVTDLTTQANQLTASDPDVVVVSGLMNSDVLVLRALDQIGALGEKAVANCSAPDLTAFHEALGALAEKPRFYTQILAGDGYPEITMGNEGDAERQKVVDAFEAYPDVAGVDAITNFTHAGWDSIQVIKLAMEAAGTDEGAAVRDALEEIDFWGAQTRIRFSAEQHRPRYDDWAESVAVIRFGADGKIELP